MLYVHRDNKDYYGRESRTATSTFTHLMSFDRRPPKRGNLNLYAGTPPLSKSTLKKSNQVEERVQTWPLYELFEPNTHQHSPTVPSGIN